MGWSRPSSWLGSKNRDGHRPCPRRVARPARTGRLAARIRGAASDQEYGLVTNARIDVFSPRSLPEPGKSQAELVSEALRRAHAYAEAGADCVFPNLLWEPDALESLISDAQCPVNVLQIPPAPSHAELAELGAARINYEACCTMKRWSSSAAFSSRFLAPRPTAEARHRRDRRRAGCDCLAAGAKGPRRRPAHSRRGDQVAARCQVRGFDVTDAAGIRAVEGRRTGRPLTDGP
jgi:hypothetical protein